MNRNFVVGSRFVKSALSFLSIAAAFLAIAPAIASPPFAVVLDGLQSPRGLTFGPGGRLYVSQAGNGGNSGKVTMIRYPWLAKPQVSDLVTGLPSYGEDPENGFDGAAGVSAIGDGTLYLIFEAPIPPEPRHPPAGHLLKLSPGGQVRDVTNIEAVDYAWFAEHPELAFPADHPDANPYGLLALSTAIYVVDSATNTLDLVRPNGSVQILAYFPDNVLADATPTCVAQGPDGALYIGTLALTDSLVFGPSAIVYRVDPNAADPSDFDTVLDLATPWATGLWPINGCAFGADGSFYASELITSGDFSGGDVVKIPFATPGTHISLTGNTLTFPAGVAVGPDANVYVSNGTAFVPQGQVVRLTNH
ncbi:MAG TPA: ScyD/ScyE family protein [Casimicrobiaceae bacterium]|nr:ScyD/ScyE family protein [Casimicrobiaceae bacterium]